MSVTSGPGYASARQGVGPAGERVLAVDIDGTRIAAGLIDERGRVSGRATAPTPADADGEAVRRAALELARSVAGAERPSLVGIGALGAIDAERGTVREPGESLPGWAGTDVAGTFAAEFGVGAFALDRVHASALGEARHGAGSGARAVLLVAVGSGVDGAYVLDGRVVPGAHGVAGRVGHLPVREAADRPCSCGRAGHLETVASQEGILAAYRRAVQARGAAGRADYDAADIREIAVKSREFSAAGELCKSVLGQSGHALGRAIGTLLNVLDPDVVVLAGAVTRSTGQAWSDGVSAGVAREALDPVAHTRIAVGALGEDAALVGAAAFARDRTAG